tara:strand:- start:1043 stop:1807 length:765 start_codon:yes stop_codon:yes gene_type:complete
MLRRRIIPFLQIDKNFDCVKTFQFDKRTYIGDIFNNIRIFNEKKVDEIVVLDIDATRMNKEPNFELIKKIASVCRMPLTYGGGVKDLRIAKKIIKLGVEKICLNNSVFNNFEIIKQLSKEIGSQSLSISINLKKFAEDYIITNNAMEPIQIDLIDYINKIQLNGAGEIILSSVDNDGVMQGFDFKILDKLLKYINIPSILIGGCSNNQNIKDLFCNYKNVAAGCSSLFIFKGKLKAVLINYPSESDKENIFNFK